MNGKRSKAIRRASERLSIGKPQVEYRTVTGRTAQNYPFQRREMKPCTRRVYQGLKRMYYAYPANIRD